MVDGESEAWGAVVVVGGRCEERKAFLDPCSKHARLCCLIPDLTPRPAPIPHMLLPPSQPHLLQIASIASSLTTSLALPHFHCFLSRNIVFSCSPLLLPLSQPHMPLPTSVASSPTISLLPPHTFHWQDEESTFYLLATLVDHILYPQTYSPHLAGCHVEMRTLASLAARKLPRLHRHLGDLECDVAVFATDWWVGEGERGRG